MIVVFVKGCIV